MDLSKAKVLIVDDEEDITEMLEELYVEQFGCKVFIASNGLEALEILKNEDINLLSVDYKMPIMDGSALIKAIREGDTTFKNMHILLVSAFGEEISELVSTYNDILLINKPIDEDQLLSNAKIYLMKSMAS